MKLLKVSEFFNKDIPPIILGGFFSRRQFTEDNKYIFIYTSYKESNVITTNKIDFNNYTTTYIKKLNEESSPYSYWNTKDIFTKELNITLDKTTGQAFFVLENDLNINEDIFYNKIYVKLISTCKWINDENLNENKKSFIRGFMELRGSIDTKADYISQDYFYSAKLEIKKARLLVDYLYIPSNAVNINFRQLQKDYYTGKRKRNTQFRLNIWWYMENIGIINAYKAELFSISRNLELPEPKNNIYYFYNDTVKRRIINNILDERINFYSTNVFEHELTSDEIKKLRNELSFDDKPTNIRNRALVETIRLLAPDKCMGCKNEYDIKDRSFINRRTGKYYFEVHHVISIGSNKELDDENNMVKLCPVCHSALKKGSGTMEKQKELINQIFKNDPKTLEFAKNFFNTNDYNTIVDLTYKNLN